MRPMIRFAFGVSFAVLALCGSGCQGEHGLVLTQLSDARAAAADIRVDFLKAVDKSSEAVMADTDEHSIAASHEASDAHARIQSGIDKLGQLLGSLGYADDTRLLETFKSRYAEYKALDDTIRELAIENSNLKAQRILFGPQTDATTAIRAALDAAAGRVPARAADRARSLAAQAASALLEIQIVEARHITESDEAKMTEMEAQIAKAEKSGLQTIATLRGLLPNPALPAFAAVDEGLTAFKAAEAQILQLSRRNTNVRSESLTLGKKRTLTAQCEDALTALSDALGKHPLPGTR